MSMEESSSLSSTDSGKISLTRSEDWMDEFNKVLEVPEGRRKVNNKPCQTSHTL